MKAGTTKRRLWLARTALVATFVALVVLCLPARAEAMQVFVRIFENRHITCEVESSDTVASVKEKAWEKVKFDVENSFFVFAGKQLADSQTLADCSIGKDATLHLVECLPVEVTCDGQAASEAELGQTVRVEASLRAAWRGDGTSGPVEPSTAQLYVDGTQMVAEAPVVCEGDTVTATFELELSEDAWAASDVARTLTVQFGDWTSVRSATLVVSEPVEPEPEPEPTPGPGTGDEQGGSDTEQGSGTGNGQADDSGTTSEPTQAPADDVLPAAGDATFSIAASLLATGAALALIAVRRRA